MTVDQCREPATRNDLAGLAERESQPVEPTLLEHARHWVVCPALSDDEPIPYRVSGRKDDAGKLRWDLVPWDAMRSVVRVLEHGADKYGEHNWRNVQNARTRYFAAGMRHLLDWWGGEERDPDSGESHLAHAVCCALFLLDGGER